MHDNPLARLRSAAKRSRGPVVVIRCGLIYNFTMPAIRLGGGEHRDLRAEAAVVDAANEARTGQIN